MASGRTRVRRAAARADGRDLWTALHVTHPPVQTMYLPALDFTSDWLARCGREALSILARYAPDAGRLADAMGIAPVLAADLYPRLKHKLSTVPLDDLRIDFEDGYGFRPDAEEDADASRLGEAVAESSGSHALPPRFGIRIKPFGRATRARGLRTLDRFVRAMVKRAGGLPPGFVVTLAKVCEPAELTALVAALDRLERALRLPHRSIPVDVMIETPAIVMGPDGTSPLPGVARAGAGRLVAAHFGTYDYTAGCGIAAEHQRLRHPACDFARQMMQVGFAGTGVRVVDGSTNVLPVPATRSAGGPMAAGRAPSPDDVAAVDRAWRLHFDDVSHSLACGFYQGWDLHPGQLVSRYAAVYAFYRGTFPRAAARLRGLLASPAPTARAGNVQDEYATAQALYDAVRRAVRCGAVELRELLEATGLRPADLEAATYRELVSARARRR
jgi:hypothetical protein